MADPAASLGTSAVPRPTVCFDGDCGMCRTTVEGIVRLGLVQRERVAAFQSFEAEQAGKLLDANVHNELAVLDTDTGEIRSGIRGLLWAFEGSWLSPLLWIARLAPVLFVLDVAYRLIAYNRRMLSPVRPKPGQLRCACDPDFHLGLRLAFVFLCAAATALVGWGSGVLWWPAAAGAVLVLAAAGRPGGSEAKWDGLGHATMAVLALSLFGAVEVVLGGRPWFGPWLALLLMAHRCHGQLDLQRRTLFVVAALAGGVGTIATLLAT